MCRPASFVLTEHKVFWSKKSDSHEDIIREFGLHPDGKRGRFVSTAEASGQSASWESEGGACFGGRKSDSGRLYFWWAYG